MNEVETTLENFRSVIADALTARQGISRRDANTLAKRIAPVLDELTEAAFFWANSDTMPPYPRVEGQSPADLAKRFSPSQVFTALRGLQTTPDLVLDTLRFTPTDSPFARARAWEQDVANQLAKVPGLAEIRSHPLGPDRRARPDFVIEFRGRTLIVETKARPADRRILNAVEQVERYVLVFQAFAGVVVVPEFRSEPSDFKGYLAPVAVTDAVGLATTLEQVVENPGAWIAHAA